MVPGNFVEARLDRKWAGMWGRAGQWFTVVLSLLAQIRSLSIGLPFLNHSRPGHFWVFCYSIGYD
jgi:hypothetical protein